jgi:hypothetical protein
MLHNICMYYIYVIYNSITSICYIRYLLIFFIVRNLNWLLKSYISGNQFLRALCNSFPHLYSISRQCFFKYLFFFITFFKYPEKIFLYIIIHISNMSVYKIMYAKFFLVYLKKHLENILSAEWVYKNGFYLL